MRTLFILFLFTLTSFLPVQSLGTEQQLPDYCCSSEAFNKPREKPAHFTPDQLAALTSDANLLIGGLISPLSGSPCLKQTDLTVIGAQEIPLSRIYISPYMPSVFCGEWDRDCYYRRCYVRDNYEGWKFFPHQYLWFDSGKKQILLTSPNGATYDFSIAESKTTLAHPYAVSNVGDQHTPSGQFDPRNTRISIENGHIAVFLPDGTTRYYFSRKGNEYQLEKEISPNGKVLKYHYTPSGELSAIESLDPFERYVYASIKIEGLPKEGNVHFTSSTELTASYTFENRYIEGKFHKKKKPKRRYHGVLPPMMVAANTPQFETETLVHSEPWCLLQSFSGKDEIFTLEYKGFGEGNKKHHRVDKLLLPVSQEDTFVPLYEISYHPAITGEKEGRTESINSDGTKIIYHFSKNLLTTSIQYYGEDGGLKKEKIFSWDDKNWLATVELRDANKQLFFRKSYTYDSFGNPVQEIQSGNLTGNGSEESYTIKREFSQDGRNLLINEETEDGKISTFSYLPNTNLVTEKLTKAGDAFLTRETFQYDDCNNLIRKSVGDGASKELITEYTLRQQQPFLHMPEWIAEKYLDDEKEKILKRRHLAYDQYGHVSEETVYDADGAYAYCISKQYNQRGDLLSETNTLGQRRTFIYDEKGRCSEVTKFSQRQKETMLYDAKGRLQEDNVIGDDSQQQTTTYTYDCNDNLIQKIDNYGNIFSYAYDPLTHNVARSDFPPVLSNDGQTTSVSTFSTYDAFGREITKTDKNSNVTLFCYNANGFPTEITYPDGSKEYYTYMKNGEMASHTNREGLTIKYTRDAFDRVICKDYGENLGQEIYVYDSFHLIQEKDLEGNLTNYQYDGAGRKTQEEKCGRITEYAYDSLGRLSTIGKQKLITSFKRDLEDRIVEEKKSDSTGNLLRMVGYQYNEDGDLSSITKCIDNQEATERFTYDSFGREIIHQDPLGYETTTCYNESHINCLGQKVLQITTKNPREIATTETFDPFMRVVSEETLNPQGALIACWDKVFDPCGNLTHWKEHLYENEQYRSTQCTRFTYTNNNLIQSYTRAFGTTDARTTHYAYTQGSKVETKTLPDGISLSYSYDPLGFLCHLSSSDGKILHRFTCNKKGELLSATDEKEKITIQREVDPFGNVTRELFPSQIEVNKSYDAFDRLTALHMSDFGYVLYSYDPLFLRDVSRFSPKRKLLYTHNYESYDLSGNLLSENMINKCGKVKHSMDLKGRKKEISSPYFSQKCLYDACDNLLQSTIDQTSTSHTYDALSQLISENTQSYSYDSLFNRTSKNDQHFQTNDLNELCACSYDLNGNLIQKDQIDYVYDPLNRLKEATCGTKRLCFQYDPLGRRLTKIVFDKTPKGWNSGYRENYLYNGQQEIGAITQDKKLKNLRVLGVTPRKDFSTTIAIELNNKIYAPLTDANGNIRRLVDTSKKKITSCYDFTAFGEETTGKKDENPWRYASKRFDSELNLVNFGKRYYDPELARWLTTDPEGFLDSLNPYQYAYNNPYSYYDPNGEFLFLACIPFALLFTPVAIQICVDAIAVGIGCWGIYEGMKYTASTAGSPYTISEDVCYDVVEKFFEDRRDNAKADRSTKKHREKKYPGSPKDLEKNPDWKETTHPGEAKSGSRVFENTKSGEKVRYDKGKPGRPGHKAHDHYHRYNPKASKGRSGDQVRHLDSEGNPVPDGSDKSHLYPPEGVSWE